MYVPTSAQVTTGVAAFKTLLAQTAIVDDAPTQALATSMWEGQSGQKAPQLKGNLLAVGASQSVADALVTAVTTPAP